MMKPTTTTMMMSTVAQCFQETTKLTPSICVVHKYHLGHGETIEGNNNEYNKKKENTTNYAMKVEILMGPLWV